MAPAVFMDVGNEYIMRRMTGKEVGCSLRSEIGGELIASLVER